MAKRMSAAQLKQQENRDLGGRYSHGNVTSGVGMQHTFPDSWDDDLTPAPRKRGGLKALFSRKPKTSPVARTPIDAHHYPTKTRYQVMLDRGGLSVRETLAVFDNEWEAESMARKITGATVVPYTSH